MKSRNLQSGIKNYFPPALGISMFIFLWTYYSLEFNIYYSIAWATMAFIIGLLLGIIINYTKRIYSSHYKNNE